MVLEDDKRDLEETKILLSVSGEASLFVRQVASKTKADKISYSPLLCSQQVFLHFLKRRASAKNVSKDDFAFLLAHLIEARHSRVRKEEDIIENFLGFVLFDNFFSLPIMFNASGEPVASHNSGQPSPQCPKPNF